MAGMTLTNFRVNIRTMLGASGAIYPDNEIDRAVAQALGAVSRYFPREVIAEFSSSYTQQVTGESITSSLDVAVALTSARNAPVVRGSVTVTNSAATTTYTEDTDYTIDYINGTITCLSTGAIPDATTIKATYQRDPNTINISSIISKLVSIERIYRYISGEQVHEEVEGYEAFGDFIRIILADNSRIQDSSYFRLWYHAAHTVPTVSVAGSCPEFLDELVALGASGYTLLTEAMQRDNQAITDLASARTSLGSLAALHTSIGSVQSLIVTGLVAAVAAVALVKTTLELSLKTITAEVDTAVAMILSTESLDIASKLSSAEGALSSGATALVAATTDLARIDTATTGDLDLFATQLSQLSTLVDAIDTRLAKVDTYLEGTTTSAKDVLAAMLAGGAELDKLATALTKVTTYGSGASDSILAVLDAVDAASTGDIDKAKAALDKVDTEALSNSTGTSGKSADDYLDTGDALIASVNTADNVPENYRQYAETKLGIAGRFIEEAQSRGMLGQLRVQAAQQYSNLVQNFIQEAQGWINSAQTRLGMVQQYISMSETFIAADRLLSEQAQAKFNLLQAHLVKIQRNIESANAANDTGNAYATIANGYFTSANMLIQQAQVGVANSQAQLQAAELRYRAAQGYMDETTGRLNYVAGCVSQIRSYLDQAEAYMTEATVYQNSSSREREIADAIKLEANSRLRDFFVALADRSQTNPHKRSISVRQYAR